MLYLYTKVSFIRKFFPDISPPLIMFPYFRLENLVGPTPSSSPISTLYIDWSSLAFLVNALSLLHGLPYLIMSFWLLMLYSYPFLVSVFISSVVPFLLWKDMIL